MKTYFFLFFTFLFQLVVFSQELNCRVSVNYSQTTNTNTQIFQSMQRDISEFMNTKQWTNYIFNFDERIDCTILINVTQYDGVDNFVATLQVSSNRPVYNTSLTTPILNLKEGEGLMKFNYVENQAIEFNENTYTNELASTLAFYAYIILGYDFDTFSELGGTDFFDKAQNIVTLAQSSPNGNAWKSFGVNKEDNRYFLVKNITSPNFKSFRVAFYKYHRMGLDIMVSDVVTGRQGVTEAIELIKQVYQKKPNNYPIQIFIESKRQEILNIYSEATSQETKRVSQSLKIIDVTNADKYDNMGQKE